MPVRIVDSAGLRLAVDQRLARGAVRLPVADHLLEVRDQQVGCGRQVLGAPIAIAAGAVGGVVVGIGALAGAGPGAVQVLAPQQEFDRVVAGRDIGLDVAGFLQRARQQLRRDLRGVDLGAVDLDRRVGDDVRRIQRVLVGLRAVAPGDIVDQAFVERPGIHAAFPIVDDRVAEAVDLGLLIGRPRRLPGRARRVQRVGRRLGDQRVDRLVEQLGRGERILVFGERDVGIGRDHRLAGRCRPWPAARRSPPSAPSRRRSRPVAARAVPAGCHESSSSPQ